MFSLCWVVSSFVDYCYLMTGPNFHHFHFVLTGSVSDYYYYCLLLLLSTSLLSDLKLFFFDTGL